MAGSSELSLLGFWDRPAGSRRHRRLLDYAAALLLAMAAVGFAIIFIAIILAGPDNS